MVNEYWINNQNDLVEFKGFLADENLTPKLIGKTDSELIYEVRDMRVYVPNKFKVEPETTKYDRLIFGKDSTEEVVNITIKDEKAFIYFKNGRHEIRPYLNWAIGRDAPQGGTRLTGNQYYKWIKDLDYNKFMEIKNNWNPKMWTPRTMPEGFMLRSGMTYFKGMKVNEVSLLSFDIETTSLDKEADNAEVVLLSMTYRDREGKIFKAMFDIFDYKTKKEFWYDINQAVLTWNPDVILGHNIISFDLPYADHNSIGLDWGRDGSRITFEEKTSKIRKDGSQQYDFHNVNIHGREVIDTFFLSLKYDIGREFPSYGLKAIEKHLGLVKENRSWDFQTWPVWKVVQAYKDGNTKIWADFKAYCGDDSDSPIKMFDIMIPSLFYLCQAVPKTLQQMINEASGSQLDSLMIRSYLQDGCSLPNSSRKQEFEGAISMGIPGIYKNVRKVDVASLYPSIMLQYKIHDHQKDPKNHMLQMLAYFRDERLKNKKLASDTGDKYYDDLQNAQKIMINSMYGFLGAGYLLFNYPEGAAEVTRYGREILQKGVEWSTGHILEKVIKTVRNEGTEDEEEKYHWIVGEKVSQGLGYTLVNVDTDSFSYTDGSLPTKGQFKDQIKQLNSIYPELISWEDDGVYEKVIIVKAKNYVLKKHKDWCKPKDLDKNGEPKLKVKGSSLTDQKKEPRLLTLLEQYIDVLIRKDTKEEQNQGLIEVYDKCCKEVVSNFNVYDWCTKKTVTKAILNAKRENEIAPFNAISEAVAKGVMSAVQEGDKVYLYVAIDGKRPKMAKGQPVVLKKTGEVKMIPNDIYRVPELWNGKDQDTMGYLSRVYDTSCILENIMDVTQFNRYASPKKKDLLEKLKCQ